MDNIAQISVAPIDKKPIPTWAVICVLIGILALTINPLIGIALVIAGGGYCAYWYNLNSRLGHYLALELNSGRRMYFRGKDDAFLKEIMRLMGDCMNHKNVGYTIHMEQATVENMQLGDHNTMV